jgi:hypothetical protein
MVWRPSFQLHLESRLNSWRDLLLDSPGRPPLIATVLALTHLQAPANSILEATSPSRPFRKSSPQQNKSPSPHRSVSPCVRSTIAAAQEAPEKANPKKSPGPGSALHSEEVVKARAHETDSGLADDR